MGHNHLYVGRVVVRQLVIEYDHSNKRCLRGGAVYPQLACEANMGIATPSTGWTPVGGGHVG